MRILWFSNKILSDIDDGTTATWAQAMANSLVRSGEVELANITMGKANLIRQQDSGAIRQWLVPAHPKLGRDGLPAQKIIDAIVNVITEFKPDLIHVWGTEYYWGLLTARKILQTPALLEMQGHKTAIVPVFHGELTLKEQIACIGFKEIVKHSSIFQERKKFEDWSTFEKEIIANHSFISAHSNWMVEQVRGLCSNANIFRTDRVLRHPFYNSKKWEHNEHPTIYCSSAYPLPFKGLHVAIRSIGILKKRYPDIQLRIAGPHQRTSYRQEGYIAWINRMIKRLGIEANVQWLWSIPAQQVVEELLNSSVFLMPSFIETYGVALAEAMYLGVPSVTAYSGGPAYLAKDEETALFFPPGDEVMCAHQIERLLTDALLAKRLSTQSREVALVRHDRERIVQQQLNTYNQVLKTRNNKQDSKGGHEQ